MIPISSDFQVFQAEIDRLRAQIIELEGNNQKLFNFWQQAYQRALPLQDKERFLLSQISNAIANARTQVEQGNYEQTLIFLESTKVALQTLQKTEK